MGAQQIAQLDFLAALGHAAALSQLLAGVDDPAVLTRPLRTAVERGHDAVVALLLGEGADAHSVVGGVTPMGLACANERMSTVRLLLKYGVDFSGLGPRGAWWLAEFVDILMDGYLQLDAEHGTLTSAMREAQLERQQLSARIAAQRREIDELRALLAQLQAGGAG